MKERSVALPTIEGVTGEGEGSFPFTDELDVDGQIDKVNVLLYESGLRTGDLWADKSIGGSLIHLSVRSQSFFRFGFRRILVLYYY